MNRAKWQILLGGGIFLCFMAMAGILVGWLILRPSVDPSLPQYSLDQVDSDHAGFRRTTLTYGSTVYVNDYEESALTAFGAAPTQMIGRLPFSEDAVSGVYVIPGQDASAYVLEYDAMYQAVYRNAEHPPFDWRTADFQSMRFYSPSNSIETSDPQIIRDVFAALKSGTPITVPLHVDGNYPGYENHGLMAFSDQLPGLGYVFGVHVATDGTVYLAENSASAQWFPAGSLFTNWMNP
jgi:hypothetical protein